MPYDYDSLEDLFAAGRALAALQSDLDPRDPRSIAMLIEVSALSLSPKSGATFTHDELLAEVRLWGGDTITRADIDAATFLKRHIDGKLSLDDG